MFPKGGLVVTEQKCGGRQLLRMGDVSGHCGVTDRVLWDSDGKPDLLKRFNPGDEGLRVLLQPCAAIRRHIGPSGPAARALFHFGLFHPDVTLAAAQFFPALCLDLFE